MSGRSDAWRSTLLNALSDAVFVLDADGSIVEVNDSFVDVFGYGPEGLPYHTPYPWWPDLEDRGDHDRVNRGLAEYLTGDGVGRWRLPHVHPSGRRMWVELSTAALPARLGPGHKMVGIARDVTGAHRVASRDRLLAEVGRVLTDPGDLVGRLRSCAEVAAAVLDELVVIIQTGLDGELTLSAAAHPSRPELAEAALRLIPPRIPPALQPRYQAGGSFVLPHEREEMRTEGPGAESARALLGEHSALLAPLAVAGRVHGILGIASTRGTADDHDLALAEELGRRIAGAMETERLTGLERRLHEASTALAAAATTAEAAAALAAAVRDTMDATICAVYTPDPEYRNWLRLRHVTGHEDAITERFSALRLDAEAPVSEAARTGTAVWLPDQAAWQARYPTLASGGVMRDVHAAVALPIGPGVGDELLGALSVGFDRDRTFPPEESRFVQTLVAQAGQAFERAALTDDRWRVSQALQDNLLPTGLPILERLASIAHYQPAGRDIHAGGDWHDIIALDDTRIAVIVGDVVGNGPVAAATMGKLSSALAAYLREGHGPAAALDRLSDYARRLGPAPGSTAICLVLDTATGELRGAGAGHPPPLLLEPDQVSIRFWTEPSGDPLGVPDAAPRTEARRRVSPGATVLLYTDGLVERRGEAIGDGLERLRGSVSEHLHTAPADLLGAVLDGCLPESGPTDDVAVVIARYLPAALRVEVPAQPHQLGLMRREVAAWAEANCLSEESGYDLQLALGEAVANAIEHAYRGRTQGTVSYDLTLSGNWELRARVTDRGVWRPPPDDPGHRGRGLELLSALAREMRVSSTEGGGTTVEFVLPWTARARG
jgi:PAS domain S-box-containing protein